MTLHIMLVMNHTLVAEMELIGSGVVPMSFLLLSTLAFSGMRGHVRARIQCPERMFDNAEFSASYSWI
jgi:hypothetical protein